MTAIKLENDVRWDGEYIVVWASSERGRVECRIPRKTIHSIPLFADAITREIDRDRNEIVDRLRPILVEKIAGSDRSTMYWSLRICHLPNRSPLVLSEVKSKIFAEMIDETGGACRTHSIQ